MKVKAYLQTADGQCLYDHVRIEREERNGVHIYWIDGISEQRLDENFGAGMDFHPDMEAFVADCMFSEYWCHPVFGHSCDEVPDETQGLIYRKSDGLYGVLLPAVSEQYKCVLVGNPEGGLTAKLFSWYPAMNHCHALAFVHAEGKHPFRLLEQCTEVMLTVLHNGVRKRQERRYPEVFEYLGWCSWDAMQIRINEKELLQKCEEFSTKGIPVRWVMLDDMWARIEDFHGRSYATKEEMISLMHASRLYAWQADPERFPDGLEGCIEKLHAYGLKVGVWHPTTGYWSGYDPDGPAYQEYRDCLIEAGNGAMVPDYRQEKAYTYYDRIHHYLRRCGADFVKIDNQSITKRFYKGLAPVGTAARQFHQAMEASVGANFDNAVINCMGMASEDQWNRSASPIARCSDDFEPESKAWFSKHILQCAYNSLFQGQLYFCDWDMWWTDDAQALKNSILRAVSGGPVYVSDPLGRSRKEVLMPLILSDGRILRCDRPAMPTEDCLTQDPRTSGRLFKLQNLCGQSGILAVFNLGDQEKVQGTISPEEMDGLEDETYAVYEYFSRECHVLGRSEHMDIEFDAEQEVRLYIFVPVRDGFAVIGRTDKYIMPATVRCVIEREPVLYEAGECAIVKDGQLIFIQGKSA